MTQGVPIPTVPLAGALDVPEGLKDLKGTVISNSRAASLAACQTKAIVEHHLRLTPTKATSESAPLLTGSAVHGALAHYFRGGTVEESMLVLRAMYRKWADENVPQKEPRLCWPNVERCMWSWFEQYPWGSLPFDPIPELVEVPFVVKLGNSDIYLTGLLDDVVRDRVDSRFYILENKSTGQRAEWWMKQWRMGSQVSHYSLAAGMVPKIKEFIGDQKIAGTYINKVDMGLLPSDPHKKCREHGNVPYAECGLRHAKHQIQSFKRSPEQLLEWMASLTHLVERWKAVAESVQTIEDVRLQMVPQEGLFNGECKFCDLNDWCATGRKNYQMLKPAPPSPLEALILEEMGE